MSNSNVRVNISSCTTIEDIKKVLNFLQDQIGKHIQTLENRIRELEDRVTALESP